IVPKMGAELPSACVRSVLSGPWHSVQWMGRLRRPTVAWFTWATCAPTPADVTTALPFESLGGAEATLGSALTASLATRPGVPWHCTQPVRLAFRVTRPFTCVGMAVPVTAVAVYPAGWQLEQVGLFGW